MKEMNALLKNAIEIIKKARKSLERQNEVNIAIEAEFSNFSSEINREFNKLYNRICKIKRDYKNRIEFLKSMCQHYTNNLSHRMNELAFDEMEIWQKLNKLEWDIIILQCVGRSLIEASTSYLSEIYFDNIEQTLHKTKKNLTQIDNIVANNYNLSIAYGITLSPVPSVFASEISVDDNKFMEILQLISNSVQNVQRLPCIADGNYVDQNNLIDEARKLLTICNNIQQKIMNVEYLNTTRRSHASNDSNDKTASSTDHRIINTSDLNSKQQ